MKIRKQAAFLYEAGKGKESELIESLCGNDGVLAVKYIRISADRTDCRKTPSGIQIPPHGIAYCGSVELITAER